MPLCSLTPSFKQAKQLELKGWSYPRHLRRHFGLIVHGDSVGAEMLRRSLSVSDMKLSSAGSAAEADGYVGNMEPYATSHTSLDEERKLQGEGAEHRAPWARRST
jgi:hypothetical protein